MSMTITQMPCNPGNYTAKRTGAIRYLVVHYTGAPGTARTLQAADTSAVIATINEPIT